MLDKRRWLLYRRCVWLIPYNTTGTTVGISAAFGRSRRSAPRTGAASAKVREIPADPLPASGLRSGRP